MLRVWRETRVGVCSLPRSTFRNCGSSGINSPLRRGHIRALVTTQPSGFANTAAFWSPSDRREEVADLCVAEPKTGGASRRTGQAIPNKLGKESREQSDAFLDARFFERRPCTSCVPRANNLSNRRPSGLQFAASAIVRSAMTVRCCDEVGQTSTMLNNPTVWAAKGVGHARGEEQGLSGAAPFMRGLFHGLRFALELLRAASRLFQSPCC